MKKIINGRRYDTDTATMMGEASHGGRNDFSFFSEELYKKRTGEFFLYGEGGPASKYAVSAGQNSWSGGKKIEPLTLAEAQEWAEENLEGEEYEDIFGAVEEDKDQVSTWVLSSIKEEADRLREEKGYTLAQIFEAGIKALQREELKC